VTTHPISQALDLFCLLGNLLQEPTLGLLLKFRQNTPILPQGLVLRWVFPEEGWTLNRLTEEPNPSPGKGFGIYGLQVSSSFSDHVGEDAENFKCLEVDSGPGI
jgi:hypothetical protein